MVRSGVQFQFHLPDLAVRFHIFCPPSILSPTWFPGNHTLQALLLLNWPGFPRALCCFLLIPYILKHLVYQPFSWSVSSTPFWFIEIVITPALHACPPHPVSTWDILDTWNVMCSKWNSWSVLPDGFYWCRFSSQLMQPCPSVPPNKNLAFAFSSFSSISHIYGDIPNASVPWLVRGATSLGHCHWVGNRINQIQERQISDHP